MPKIKFPGLPSEPGEPAGNFYDGPVPPAGTYKGVVKWIKVKENKNGDAMLNGIVEIREPKSSKKKDFNGYGMFFNQNVTEQGAPYLNQFLTALGAKYKDMVTGNVVVDSEEPPNIMKIGLFKVGDNPIVVATRRGEWQGQDRLEITRFLADKDEADDDEIDEEVEEDEEYEEDEDEDEEADEEEVDEDEDESEEEDEDDEEGYTREDLEDLAILELKGILKENDWTPADYKGYTKDDLINAILGEGDEDEEDEDEAEDEPPF